jgi:DNA mismatch repair ATPase MutL
VCVCVCVRTYLRDNRFETLQRTTVIHQQPLIMPLLLEATASEEIVISENLETFENNGFKIQIDENAISGRKIKLLSVPFSKHILFGQDDVRELASLIADSQDSEGGCYISKLMLKNDRIDFNKSSSMKKNEKKMKFESENEVEGVIVLDADNDNDNENSSSSTQITTDDSQEDVEEERKQFIRIPKLISMFASRACRSAIMIGTAMQHHEMKSVVGRLEKIEQPWNCPHGRPTMRHLVDLQSIRRKRRKYPVSNLLKFTRSMPMSDEL